MKHGAVKNIEKEVLSDNWYHLYKYSFDYQREDGTWEHQQREVYDRGDGAAILLYNPQKKTVVLTRQFRMPYFARENAHDRGMLIEVCAGLLDGDDPEGCIKKETLEETGFAVHDVKKVFESIMSPGSLTELLHFFICQYEPRMKIEAGGGSDQETENIEVLEMPFVKAMQMVADGEIIDAKTIMLLQHAKINGIFSKGK